MRPLLIPVFLCVFSLLSLSLFGQEKKGKIVIGIESEFGAGWWIAHNGQPGQEDKSLLNFQVAGGLRLGYMINPKWEIGLTGAYDQILGYYLRAASDRVGSRDRIRIADNTSYSVRRLGLYVTTWPVQTEHFNLGASFCAGTFSETSIHPSKALFGSRRWWRARIPMAWKLSKRFWIEGGPSFHLHTISQSTSQEQSFRHTIDKLGGFIGLVIQ